MRQVPGRASTRPPPEGKQKLNMGRADKTLAAGIVLLAVAIVLAGCARPRMNRGPVLKEKLVDGVYRASCVQFPNRAVVEVTIRDHRIADIQVVSHLAWKGKKAEVPIAERMIESQSTQVDAVTGATNSSKTIMKAVQMAIEKAYQKSRGEGAKS